VSRRAERAAHIVAPRREAETGEGDEICISLLCSRLVQDRRA
jgi:hypothetical protein